MAKSSAGSPALLALRRAEVPHVVHEYAHDPAERHFGDETVAELGVDPARVFKTLVADLVGAATPVVCAVVPVAGQLDLKALAQAVGAKRATLTAPADAERVTGYVVGGISPIAQKKRLPVYLDASARGHRTILVSGGRRGLSVELAADDLAGLVGAVFADLSRS